MAEPQKEKPEKPAKTPPKWVTSLLLRLQPVFRQIQKLKSIPSQLQDFLRKNTETRDSLRYLVSGITSKDRLTRRAALVFYLSFLALIVLLSYTSFSLLKSWNHQRRLKKELHAKEVEESTRLQREIDSNVARQISLGTFFLELKEVPKQYMVRGNRNMGQVEIMVLCDSENSHDYIEQHLIPAKSQVSEVLTVIDRDEIMSPHGKRKLSAVIRERLNHWLPHGKVLEVYFSKFVIS